MKSYYFLEKEEPHIAKASFLEGETPAVVPDYESVNLLRLAKNNKNISPQDFAQIRSSVIQNGKEPKDVREQVKKLLSEQDIKDPAEVRRTRRNAALKRIVSVITMAKKELQNENLLPENLLKQMTQLAEKLQEQIEA